MTRSGASRHYAATAGRAQAGSVDIVVIPLTDERANRRFALCFKARDSLTPATARMVDFPAGRAQAAERASP
jgi:hypothetical protein